MKKEILKLIEEEKRWQEFHFRTLEKRIRTLEKTIEFLIKIGELGSHFRSLSKDLKNELRGWKVRLRRIERIADKEACLKEIIKFREDLKEFRKDVERLEMWYTSILGKWIVRNFHNIE